MTEAEVDELRGLCADHNPTKLRAYDGDELRREVPVPPSSRKKWLHVLRVIGALRWTSVEGCDRAGGVLFVYAPAGTPATTSAAIEGSGAGADLARVIISAQREVLTFRDKDTSAAMNAMVAMMGQCTAAVQTLSTVHHATLQAARTQAQLEIAAAQSVAAHASESRTEDAGDELESMQMLKVLAPQLGEQLAKGIMEKFGPILMGMLKPTAAPAAAAAKGAKPVIDINAAKNGNGVS